MTTTNGEDVLNGVRADFIIAIKALYRESDFPPELIMANFGVNRIQAVYLRNLTNPWKEPWHPDVLL